MPNTIAIIGSSRQLPESNPTIAASDRAVLGLLLRHFSGQELRVFCPKDDHEARTYATAAAGKSAQVDSWGGIDGMEALAARVVLVGQGILESGGEAFAGLLAERNGATLILDVLDIVRGDSPLIVLQDLGQGRRAELTLVGPAVLVVSPLAVKSPYVSRYKLQMAARKFAHSNEFSLPSWERVAQPPGERAVASIVDSSALQPGAAGPWQPIRPRVKLGPLHDQLAGATGRLDDAFGVTTSAAPTQNEHILQADPATCARRLLRYLAHHGFVRRTDATLLREVRPEKSPEENILNPAGIRTQNELAPRNAGSLTLRMLRGPRQQEEPRPRLARWPRIHKTAEPVEEAFMPCVARRPRPVDQPGDNRIRGPRLPPGAVGG